MNIGTWLHTLLHGARVGTDAEGNVYYQEKREPRGRRRRRWVVYKGAAEPTRVPPEWHGWLHYSQKEPPPADLPKRPWMKPHLPNLTGSAAAYRPPGHDYRGGKRDRATGDYEPWRPS